MAHLKRIFSVKWIEANRQRGNELQEETAAQLGRESVVCMPYEKELMAAFS